MRFAVVGLNGGKIGKIVQVLGIHCHDNDSNIISVKDGDEIDINVSEIAARFVTT